MPPSSPTLSSHALRWPLLALGAVLAGITVTAFAQGEAPPAQRTIREASAPTGSGPATGSAGEDATVWSHSRGVPYVATPVVTRDSARSSVSQFFYDNEKSLKVPGFSYRPLANTIRETGAQFLESVKDGSEWKVLPL